MNLQQDAPPELVLETVLVPSDANERVVAESLLQEAGIPFYAKNEDLQDLFGWGQIGGANLIVGPVKLQVPEEFAAEARTLLASVAGAAATPGEADQLATGEPAELSVSEEGELEWVGEMPPELEPGPPPDPRVASVRRLALGSVLTAIFLFGSWGSVLPIALGCWALAKGRDGIPNAWRFFAMCGVFGGLVGLWTVVTAPPSY